MSSPPLSQRELEVLTYAATGASAPITARILFIAEPTVRRYLEQARRKLGARNTTEAVAIAMRKSLIK